MNVPMFTAADVFFFDGLIEDRDDGGAERCRKKGVGRLRANLERVHPPNVVSIFDHEATSGAWTRARETARAELARICKGCPLRCELAG